MELTVIYKLKSAVDIKVLIYILRKANSNGAVSLSPIIRKDIGKTLNISAQQITNALNTLKKENLIEGQRKHYKLLM